LEASTWHKKGLMACKFSQIEPIENLWKIVKDTIPNEVLPQNKEELVNTIQKAWEEVSLKMIEVLFASMLNYMKAI